MFPVSSEAMEGLHLFHEMPKSTAQSPLGAGFLSEQFDARTKQALVATKWKIPQLFQLSALPCCLFSFLDATLNGG